MISEPPVQPHRPSTGTFGFGYDALGRRTSLTRPNGVGTSYSYDSLSRLLSVLHNGGALPEAQLHLRRRRQSPFEDGGAGGQPQTGFGGFPVQLRHIYELTQAVVNGAVAEGYSTMQWAIG